MQSGYVVNAYERAGDVAQEHHFYRGAGQHYRDALDVQGIDANVRSRLSEKLAHTLFLEGNSQEAGRWLDDAFVTIQGNPELETKLAELLYEKAQQAFAQYAFETALRDLSQTIEIAKAARNTRLHNLAGLRMCTWLWNLGRVGEAEKFLATVGSVDADSMVRSEFYVQRAMISAAYGREQAYEDFEHALALATEDGDALRAIGIWNNYGLSALALGNIDLAKEALERALLLARQNRTALRVLYNCLTYADLLTKMGHFDVAQHYVREVLSYEDLPLAIELGCAETGIRLALEVGDDAMLKRCSMPHLLIEAFKSNSPFVIGPIASAFAHLYAVEGKTHQAKRLLRRALAIVQQVDRSWDLCLEIARQGDSNDILEARLLLENRTQLPNSTVAQAYLLLFDAYISKRDGAAERMRQSASEAAAGFEQLHWYANAKLARTLLPSKISVGRPQHTPSRMRSLLTKRQYQIAELVLRGFTNSTVAQTLKIQERTVETHMTSIMSRLGVRSRYQIGGPENSS